MTLQAQWNLTYDDPFRSRSRACLTNEAAVFGVGDIAGEQKLAEDILLEDPQKISTFLTLVAGYGDYAERCDTGDGTVNSDKLTDEDIVTAVDTLFPTVAELFYPASGGAPPAGTEITTVTPNTGPPNKSTTVTITGKGLAQTHRIKIGKDCHNTVVTSDTEVVTDTPGNQAAGVFPVTITMQDLSVLIGPDFTYA